MSEGCPCGNENGPKRAWSDLREADFWPDILSELVTTRFYKQQTAKETYFVLGVPAPAIQFCTDLSGALSGMFRTRRVTDGRTSHTSVTPATA